MSHGRLNTVLRYVGISVLGLLGLIVALVFSAAMVVRTDYGHKKIVQVLVPVINKSLLGRVEIGSLDGNLLSTLIVRDVKLYDSEQQLAASVGRVEVHHAIMSLVRKNLHVTSAEIKDAQVRLRYLKDGRLNFAALTRPSPQGGPLPITITVSKLGADLALSFTGPPSGKIPTTGAQIHLEAAAKIADPRFAVDLKTLKIFAAEPLQADIELHGGVSVVNVETPQIDARDLLLTVHTQGEQINRLVQAAELQGDYDLSLLLAGPLNALSIKSSLHLPKGQLDLDATVGALDPKLPWQFQIQAHEIDPSAARKGLPAAQIEIKMQGRGQGPKGRVDLQQLALQTADAKARATLDVQGFVDGNATQDLGFPLPRELSAKLEIKAHAPQLGALLSPIAKHPPPLAGALRLSATAVAENGTLRTDIDLAGQKLRFEKNGVDTLTLALHTVDLLGSAKLQAHGLRTPLPLDRLELDAAMTKQAINVHAVGSEQRKLTLELLASGVPELSGSKLEQLAVTLQKLMLTRGNDQLALRAPAHISLVMKEPAGAIVDLDRLALRLGAQEIAAAGHFEAKEKRFRATVDASSINARRWAQLFGVTQVPETAITLHARAAGTPQHIDGRVQLQGTVSPLPAYHLPRSELRADVLLQGQHVRGDVDLQLDSPTHGERPHVTLRAAAPLTMNGAIDVELHAQTLAQDWQQALPRSVATLRGLLKLDTTLRGTLQRPELALQFNAPWFQLEPLRGRGVALNVSYLRDQLDVKLDGQVASNRDVQLGALTLAAKTRLHLGIGSNVNGAEIKHQVLHAPLEVDATISRIDLGKLVAVLSPPPSPPPGQVKPPKEPPLKSGVMSATLNLRGSAMAPKLELAISGKDITGSGFKNVSVGVGLHYAGSAATLDVDAGMAQQKLLIAHAETTLAMPQILAGTFEPQKLPLRATLDIKPYQLSQISKVNGSLTAHAEVHGTAGAPQVQAKVHSQSLQIEDFAVGPLDLNVSLDEKKLLKADLDARQKDGLLQLSAQTFVPPRPDAARLHLVSKNFRLDYNPHPGAANMSDVLGMVHGVLNAELHVQTAAEWRPSVRGYVKLEHGGLMMKALQQPLNDIYVDIQVAPDEKNVKKCVIALRDIRVVADTGRAKLSGRVQLDGLKLESVSLDADARNFPVWAGVFGLWIDSKVTIRSHNEDDTMLVGVDIADGTVRVPKLQSARTVQPLGPFEDVQFVDLAAQQAAIAANEKEKEEARKKAAGPTKHTGFLPSHIKISVQLPEDFRVTGPELRTDLSGRIDLDIGPKGLPRINGQIHTVQGWGWVEIFRRRYEINQIQVSMAGENPPNPRFNIEIARKVDEGTIYIMVTGTGKKPRVSFRSDPPLYSESQIIAMILTGDNGASKKDTQAMGILSSLLIGQIRDQLAGRLPIDVIRVDVAGNDPLGVGSTSLEIGKYIRDDLYLGYKRRFGGVTTGMRRANADEALLEYHFFRSYKLRTLYGDANVGAIDLYWTKRF